MSERSHHRLAFEQGSLLLHGPTTSTKPAYLVDEWVWDDRVDSWRAHASDYRRVFAELHRAQQRQEITLQDDARGYTTLTLHMDSERVPRHYQKEAVDAWMDAGGQGQVVLPTGAGKSYVAAMIMQRIQRDTLIVVPTLDLMHQWYSDLRARFALDEVGLLGGGYHECRAVTVTTYDSFWIHAPHVGHRFGLLVFDECHHLPSATYQQAAQLYIAPWRLGLTATPERDDGGEAINIERIGPIVYRRGIKELAGDFLADYDIEMIRVDFNEQERQEYEQARKIYLDFVSANGIRFGSAGGWTRFLQLCARSEWGRSAMRAYRAQRQLALSPEAKMVVVGRLLHKHAGDQVIIFTNQNDAVYELSKRWLIPAITHQTPTKERRLILENFRSGRWPVVATSRVLNEGVDVPEASVAIVLSGSGTVREHVQRLGRILRQKEGKMAVLYELITNATVEESVSERRRDHDAYR